MSQPRPTVETTPELVRALLAEQFPAAADEAIAFVGQGWDCALYRLGADRALRLPIRDEPAAWLPRQIEWLPTLAPSLTLPTPVALEVGEPNDAYPYPWEIVPWFPGNDALTQPPADAMRAATKMGEFLSSLAQSAPLDAPRNPYRGVPLLDRDERTRLRLATLAPDDRELLAVWEQGLAAEPWRGAPVWLHGDLHPANWLVHDSEPSAVIDWIDICAGDPATDLALGWYCFEHAERVELFRAAGREGPGTPTWVRARAWALSIAVAIGDSDERLRDMVRFTLEQVRRDHK